MTKWKKHYLTILAGQTVSLIGSSAVQFALIWWLAEQTESALVLSLVGLVAFLPQMILGPFVGVWLDRWKRKHIVIIADLATGFAALVLSLWFLLGSPSYLGVILVIFVRSLMGVFHTPSIQAIVPLLVPEEELVQANSWAQFLQSGAFMLGPVLGAAMYAVFPLWLILLTDLIGALAASFTLWIIAVPEMPTLIRQQHYFEELKDGIQVFRQDKALLSVMIFGFLAMIFFFPLSSLFPLMTRVHFDLSAWFASVVEFAYAFGMMIGAILIGMRKHWQDKLWAAQIGNLGIGFTILVSGLTASDMKGYWLFVAMCVLMGAFGNLFNIPFTAYLQETVAPEKLGRVFSLFGSVMSAAMPLGLLIAGPVSEKEGIAFWFAISGGFVVFFSLCCMAFYAYFHRKNDEDQKDSE